MVFQNIDYFVSPFQNIPIIYLSFQIIMKNDILQLADRSVNT